MTGLFPDWIEVPPGLVKRRLIWGMPPVMIAVLVPCLAGAVYWLKWYAVLLLPVCVPLVWWLAQQCQHDPDFLMTWLGEFQLKKRYY